MSGSPCRSTQRRKYGSSNVIPLGQDLIVHEAARRRVDGALRSKAIAGDRLGRGELGARLRAEGAEHALRRVRERRPELGEERALLRHESIECAPHAIGLRRGLALGVGRVPYGARELDDVARARAGEGDDQRRTGRIEWDAGVVGACHDPLGHDGERRSGANCIVSASFQNARSLLAMICSMNEVAAGRP